MALYARIRSYPKPTNTIETITNETVTNKETLTTIDTDMTHILLVEDDPAIATSLKVTFKREGWQLTWLDNASDVLPALAAINADANQDISAIIMDVGLPDGDGLSLCQQIRQSNQTNNANSTQIGSLKDVPILFLTARSDEVDRILGLEMGGDDYCTKPFSPRELVARIKTIFRRQQITTQTRNAKQTDTNKQPKQFKLASGTWEYQPQNYHLYWQQQKLELSNTERKLLLHFLNNAHQVFSREQLLEAISEHPDHRLARTIDSHIKSIRKQLANINPAIEVIYTHRGIGYGLCET